MFAGSPRLRLKFGGDSQQPRAASHLSHHDTNPACRTVCRQSIRQRCKQLICTSVESRTSYLSKRECRSDALKRAIFLGVAVIALVLSLGAFVGYGNPLREVTFSGAGENYDVKRAFFVQSCDSKGQCVLNQKHRRVMHFTFGDGYKGHPGALGGLGQNPIAMLRSAGLKFLPQPDYEIAAVKWCTGGEIWQEFEYHSQHFIVPMTNDPTATVRCVQRQLPRKFSAYVADPIGRDVEEIMSRSQASGR